MPLLITIVFTLYLCVCNEKESKEELSKEELIDQNNSPVQLINQIKEYFHINPFIAISFSITIFSFVGIPPVIGFFAKQMVLSAALDNGYVFMAFVAILTSVIGAGYYLNLVKQIFFYKPDYEINPSLLSKNLIETIPKSSFVTDLHLIGYIQDTKGLNQNLDIYAQDIKRKVLFKPENITVNSCLSVCISIITLFLILFIYTPGITYNLVNIISLVLFKA